MRAASVFKRSGRFIVHPSSTTTAGVGIAAEPVVVLPGDVPERDLGQAILTAIRESKSGVPAPDSWADVAKPLLRAASVRSWSAFVKGTVNCEVVDDGVHLHFAPTENRGARGGFQFKPSGRISIRADSEPGAVGSALNKAIQHSE